MLPDVQVGGISQVPFVCMVVESFLVFPSPHELPFLE